MMRNIDLHDFKGFDQQLVVDAREGKHRYLIVGKNGSRIQVSPSAYQLLKAMRFGVSLNDIALAINQDRPGSTISHGELEDTCNDLMNKLSEIEDQAAKQRLPGGFWLRIRILHERWATNTGSAAAFLFNPAVSLAVLFFIAIALFKAYQLGMYSLITNASIWEGYLLFLLSLLVHEVGHASSCVRFGAQPSSIGFTIYLIYPAFYSDVSSAWQLSRRQRMVVDVGGNYFQLIFAGCYVSLFSITHWLPFHVAFLMIIYAVIFSLNPIFKFDGYWLLADALGVTNLANQPALIAKYIYCRLFRKPAQPLPWSSATASILMIYSLASIFVWGMFSRRLIPLMWLKLSVLRDYAVFITREIISKHLPSGGETRGLLTSLFVAFIVAAMLWRMVRYTMWPLIRRGIAFFGRTGAIRGRGRDVAA